MSILYKYKKYKTKYLNLKKTINQKYSFYFIHSTTVYQNLLDILKIGILYPGKYLLPEQRKLYGEEPSDYVFMNIYFDDIGNIESSRSYALLFHPKIMYEDGFYFNKGWKTTPVNESVHISKTDDQYEINQKIKSIHDFLENPSLPQKIKEFHGSLHHEILFDHPISLSNGNLIGIICDYCDSSTWDLETQIKLTKPSDEQFKLIKKAVKDKPYAHVKIFTRNTPMPKLNGLI